MNYNANLNLGEVVLNVNNLDKIVNFYQEKIGLERLNEEKNKVVMGIKKDNLPIVTLQEAEGVSEESYGLYHLAILVPDRPSLGRVLNHLVYNATEYIEGAADHGYSEAIYLHDPEGNGIEIYRDKPVSEWDIREDGRIIGVTEEMDADAVLASANGQFPETFRLPEGTTVGHVHLSVKDALKTSQLYQRVFAMGDKFTVPSASWISNGDYHHHLAFNQWAGPNLSKREVAKSGLAYFVVNYEVEVNFLAVKKKAQLYGMTIVEENYQEFILEDYDGIRSKVVLLSRNA